MARAGPISSTTSKNGIMGNEGIGNPEGNSPTTATSNSTLQVRNMKNTRAINAPGMAGSHRLKPTTMAPVVSGLKRPSSVRHPK